MQKSTFDKVADKFWQDYKNGQPIGGGMAFEAQVRECVLDETTDSLKDLDRLLNTVKAGLIDSEQALLGRAEFRNFLLFLGIYAGRVVTNYRPKVAFRWLPFDELKGKYSLGEQDKFFKISALCPEQGQPFFVWLSLGAKLFGSFNRKFTHPITGSVVPESLYWAVQAYFDELSLVDTPAPQAVPPSPSPIAQSAKISQSPQAPQSATAKPAQNLSQGTPQAPAQAKPTAKPVPKPSSKKSQIPAKDPFEEIKADLINIPAHNSTHDEHYHKANDFLAKVDKAVLDGTVLDDKQQANLSQALQMLEKVADAGNTNAMLSLAVYGLEGRLMDDKDKAVALIQKAGEMGDIRAQKLMSRLYYQGLGVNASTEMGQLWLDRAAKGGHEEAKKLQRQLKNISLMKKDQQNEVQKDKRMYITLTVVAVLFILLVWGGLKVMAGG